MQGLINELRELVKENEDDRQLQILCENLTAILDKHDKPTDNSEPAWCSTCAFGDYGPCETERALAIIEETKAYTAREVKAILDAIGRKES